MSASNLPKKQSTTKSKKHHSNEEFDVRFGQIGANAPFGTSSFPVPAKNLYYESSEPVGPRILEDERQ